MKKLISTFVVAFLFVITSTAQYDVEVNLVSPASGASATGVAGFSISYQITNNGPNAIPQGDTLVVAVFHSDNNYSLAGTEGGVTLIPLPAAFASGTTINSATIGANATVDLSSVNGEVCMFATVGVANATSLTGDPNDTDMANNADCFMSVPASALLTELEGSNAIAFPNPATDILNVLVDGEEVVSVSIISVDGKVISSVDDSVAQVTELTAGVYFYEARTSSGAVIRNTFVKN